MIHPSTEQPPVIVSVRSNNFDPAYFCFCYKAVIRDFPPWPCQRRDKTALGRALVHDATLQRNPISIDVKIRCFY